jgi:ABC-2 type transport system ATP-binding protein
MITTQNLTKEFGGYKAVNDISCSIPDGCIYGMVGSNGAGKSTFLRLITGVYKPDNGTINIDNAPVWDNPDVKKRISFVPDDLFFLQGSNINSMANFYKNIYPNFDMERCKYLTDAFTLNPKMSINNFSKGMKRQAAIILALSTRPDYMFFDETFDGLDPVMRNLVKGLICQDVIERKATAIITSHSLRELEDLCDQLALLHKGGLVLENDISNLKTTRFKVQIAFTTPYDQSLFSNIEYSKFKKIGSVSTMIVKGDKEETINRLNALKPALLDILPLTLEEVFTNEMEALGYNFDNVLEG